MLSTTTIGQWLQPRKVILLLLLIIALGTFLRIYDLGTESIGYEEACSINLSTQSIASVIENAAPTQNHPPFYFILLHFWISLFGTSAVATRSLSAIFGIISILLIYQVGSTLFNRQVGLISGFLSAISQYYIFYSQFVRTYSLLLLLSLLSYLFFIKILKGDRKWHYPCYFLTNLLLGYTHIFGLFIIASQVLFFLLFWNKYQMQRVKFATTVAVTIVTMLPLVPLLGGRVVSLATGGFWIPEPSLTSIAMTLAHFSGFRWSQLLLPIFLLLIVIGFFTIKRVEGKWNWRGLSASIKGIGWNIKFESIEEILLLILWLSIPIVIPFIISKVTTPIYLTKYMIGASPAFYILAAKGMSNLTRKYVFYPVLVFIILLSSFGLYVYHEVDVRPQWKEAANFVELNSMSNDVIIHCSHIYQPPFDYYYKGDLPEFQIRQKLEETEEVATFVDDAVHGKDRLWLILGDGDQSALIRSYLIDSYGSGSIIIQEEFAKVSVILFNLSPP